MVTNVGIMMAISKSTLGVALIPIAFWLQIDRLPRSVCRIYRSVIIRMIFMEMRPGAFTLTGLKTNKIIICLVCRKLQNLTYEIEFDDTLTNACSYGRDETAATKQRGTDGDGGGVGGGGEVPKTDGGGVVCGICRT